MQRVDTLLQKLQAQFSAQAGTADLLRTVQQLQAELLHLQSQEGGEAISTSKVAVMMPVLPADNTAAALSAVGDTTAAAATPPAAALPPTPEPAVAPIAEEKIIEVLQVDEAEIAAELEEMKRNAEAKNSMSIHIKPTVIFDEPEPETVPTLAYQPPSVKELNEVITADVAPSLNDKLKQSTLELADQLTEAPIRDLRKAIGINDRFLYINELFRGDETMYERSIKTINGFSILPEAEYWIQRELKVKLGWDDSQATVKQFNQLVKRRFS